MNSSFDLARFGVTLISLLATNATYASAEIATLTARTAEGCAIEYQEPINVPYMVNWKVVDEFNWSGRCKDGKAFGFGEFVRKSTSTVSSTTMISTTRIKSHAYLGRMMGFGQMNVVAGGSTTEKWLFSDGTGFHLSFDGFGLDGYAAILSNRSQYMPRIVAKLPEKRNQFFGSEFLAFSISDGETVFSLSRSPCIIHKEQFPECLGPDGKSRFQVHYFNQFRVVDALVGEIKGKPRFCPNPRELQSCEPLIAPLVAPMVRSAEARIQAFFDRLNSSASDLREALQEYKEASGARP